MVKIQGQFDRNDYLHAFKLHSRGSFMNWLVYCALAVPVFFAALVLVSGEGNPLELTITLAPLLIVIVFLVVAKVVFLPLNISRQLKQLKDAMAPMKAQFDETGWRFENEFGSYGLPWDAFVKWKEDDTSLVLYRSSRMFQIVPKRLFASPADLEYVHGQLRKAGIPNRTRSRLYPVQVVLSVLLGVVAISFLIHAAANRYLQMRDPVPAAEWQSIEKPGVSFRVPGPPVDDAVSADERTAMTIKGAEPTVASWSARREGHMFTVRILDYPSAIEPIQDDLDLVLYEIEARFGGPDLDQYEEIERNGKEGIRITTKHPTAVSEAFIHNNRIVVARTDWPVDGDTRIFFDSIQAGSN